MRHESLPQPEHDRSQTAAHVTHLAELLHSSSEEVEPTTHVLTRNGSEVLLSVQTFNGGMDEHQSDEAASTTLLDVTCMDWNRDKGLFWLVATDSSGNALQQWSQADLHNGINPDVPQVLNTDSGEPQQWQLQFLAHTLQELCDEAGVLDADELQRQSTQPERLTRNEAIDALRIYARQVMERRGDLSKRPVQGYDNGYTAPHIFITREHTHNQHRTLRFDYFEEVFDVDGWQDTGVLRRSTYRLFDDGYIDIHTDEISLDEQIRLLRNAETDNVFAELRLHASQDIEGTMSEEFREANNQEVFNLFYHMQHITERVMEGSGGDDAA